MSSSSSWNNSSSNNNHTNIGSNIGNNTNNDSSNVMPPLLKQQQPPPLQQQQQQQHRRVPPAEEGEIGEEEGEIGPPHVSARGPPSQPPPPLSRPYMRRGGSFSSHPPFRSNSSGNVPNAEFRRFAAFRGAPRGGRRGGSNSVTSGGSVGPPHRNPNWNTSNSNNSNSWNPPSTATSAPASDGNFRSSPPDGPRNNNNNLNRKPSFGLARGESAPSSMSTGSVGSGGGGLPASRPYPRSDSFSNRNTSDSLPLFVRSMDRSLPPPPPPPPPSMSQGSQQQQQGAYPHNTQTTATSTSSALDRPPLPSSSRASSDAPVVDMYGRAAPPERPQQRRSSLDGGSRPPPLPFPPLPQPPSNNINNRRLSSYSSLADPVHPPPLPPQPLRRASTNSSTNNTLPDFRRMSPLENDRRKSFQSMPSSSVPSSAPPPPFYSNSNMMRQSSTSRQQPPLHHQQQQQNRMQEEDEGEIIELPFRQSSSSLVPPAPVASSELLARPPRKIEDDSFRRDSWRPNSSSFSAASSRESFAKPALTEPTIQDKPQTEQHNHKMAMTSTNVTMTSSTATKVATTATEGVTMEMAEKPPSDGIATISKETPAPVVSSPTKELNATTTAPTTTATSTVTTMTPPMAVKTMAPVATMKTTPSPPLTCSSLGDPRLVAQAETAVQQLCDLVPNPQVKGSTREETVLPPKQLILKAVAGLDMKIKRGQIESKKVKIEMERAVEEESGAERLRQVQRQREEAKRKEDELLRQAEEKSAQEAKVLEQRKQELQAQWEEKQRLHEEGKKLAQDSLEERIRHAKSAERRRRKMERREQIEAASKNFDKDIALAQRELDDAERDVADVEAKAANVAAKHDSSKTIEDDEIPLPELANELEAQHPVMRDVVSLIISENKRRAREAQHESMSLISCSESMARPQSPQCEDRTQDGTMGKNNDEWTSLTRQVTGLADALYTEPSENPCFEQHCQTHAIIEPLVKEYVRDKRRRLQQRWEELAEEYVVRKQVYSQTAQTSKLPTKEKLSGSKSIASRASILGDKPTAIGGRRDGIIPAGNRNSGNPYRRARRGNQTGSSSGLGDVVRSEYEQEQIIAELTAKEAMEKRIAHGGSKLPRQVCQVEKDLYATFINTFSSNRVFDPMAEAEQQSITNIWSDMEKCIFLDRFMQHPKDFRKIASYLRNKTAKDCVSFYYNSKQSVPYKAALKEHIMRRKRRGDYSTWDATIQAALSVGAVVKAGQSEDRPLVFTLPDNDHTYFTRNFHPMNREIFDSINISIKDISEDILLEATKEVKSRKRPTAALFTLDAEQQKFLRTTSQESVSSVRQKSATTVEDPLADLANLQRSLSSSSELQEVICKTEESGDKSQAIRKAPQKWTATEKKLFFDTVEKHGKNWPMLASAVGSKTISQIKNYYYDHKKQFGKHRAGGENQKVDDALSVPGEPETNNDSSNLSRITQARSQRGDQSRRSGGNVDTGESRVDMGNRLDNDDRTVALASSSSTTDEGPANEIGGGEMREQGQIHDASNHASPAPSDVWNQAQQQAHLLQMHAANLTSQEARRLMQSQTHQQMMTNLSSILPWVTAAQVAQAQVAALQQQDGNSLGATRAAVRDWVEAAQMQNMLALRQAGHHGFSMDPSSHLRSIAMTGLAGLNPASLPSNALLQMENAGVVNPSALRTNKSERLENMVMANARAMHGFGGNSGRQDGISFGQRGGGGVSSAPSSASTAAALGLLARAIPRADGNGHGFSQPEGGNPNYNEGKDGQNEPY